MSTRSQIQVRQTGMQGDWDDKITLYHHSDGYPSNILTLIQKAYEDVKSGAIFALNEDMKRLHDEYPKYTLWKLGRAGKVASYLCAEDPGEFEPEAGHELHGDIEWYYIVECVNEHGGSMAENPTWKIYIYEMQGFDNTELPEPLDVIDVSEIDKWLNEHENLY